MFPYLTILCSALFLTSGCSRQIPTDGIMKLRYLDYASTSIAINEHSILTAAHVIPHSNIHLPYISVGSSHSTSQILNDGWATKRVSPNIDFLSISSEEVQTDFLILKSSSYLTPTPATIPTNEQFSDILSECSSFYLATINKATQTPIIIPAETIVYDQTNRVIAFATPGTQATHYLSGSGLLGSTKTNKLYLLGIVSGYGSVPIDGTTNTQTVLACPSFLVH